MNTDIELTIGSDPEFVIMCGDSVENALEIFKKVGDFEHCCECPHPDSEDIANIYEYSESYGDKKQYIKNAVKYIDTKELISDYDFLAAETLLVIFDYEIKELLKIDKFKEVMLLYNENYDNDIINILLQENKHITILEEGIETVDYDKINIVREILRNEPEYLVDVYDFLSKDKKVKFDDETVDQVVEYLADFETLDDLPEEIQDNIRYEIEQNYETDCSACDVGESYFCTTELGCDGQSALGEMRPEHGNNPIEHFNEILKLMEELNDLLSPEIICYGNDELQVKAGAVQGQTVGERFQLGGHIHIGSNKHLPITLLGDYLSFFCGIPLTLITDTEKKYGLELESERNARHSKSQYGQYDSYREKPYGIEFRMPSSWLVSPQITIGALSLAYVVSHEFILKLIQKMGHIWDIEFKEKYGTNYGMYIGWYKNQNWTLLQGEFKPIKLEIQQMELYPEYKEYIDYILDMIDRNETWHSERNILPLWAEMW